MTCAFLKRTAGVAYCGRSLQWRRKQLGNLKRLLKENEKALAGALATDLRKPYVEAVLYDVWSVLGEIAYFEKNLEKLYSKEKLPTPFNLKPLSYEVLKPWLSFIGQHTQMAQLFCPVRPSMFTININNNNNKLHTSSRV